MNACHQGLFYISSTSAGIWCPVKVPDVSEFHVRKGIVCMPVADHLQAMPSVL